MKRKAFCILLMNKLHSQNERNQDYALQRRAIAFYLRRTFNAMLLNHKVRRYNREQATSLYVRKLCINFFRVLIRNKEESILGPALHFRERNLKRRALVSMYVHKCKRLMRKAIYST